MIGGDGAAIFMSGLKVHDLSSLEVVYHVVFLVFDKLATFSSTPKLTLYFVCLQM